MKDEIDMINETMTTLNEIEERREKMITITIVANKDVKKVFFSNVEEMGEYISKITTKQISDKKYLVARTPEVDAYFRKMYNKEFYKTFSFGRDYKLQKLPNGKRRLKVLLPRPNKNLFMLHGVLEKVCDALSDKSPESEKYKFVISRFESNEKIMFSILHTIENRPECFENSYPFTFYYKTWTFSAITETTPPIITKTLLQFTKSTSKYRRKRKELL